jgi:hypothetical protein
MLRCYMKIIMIESEADLSEACIGFCHVRFSNAFETL